MTTVKLNENSYLKEASFEYKIFFLDIEAKTENPDNTQFASGEEIGSVSIGKKPV